MVTDLVGGHLQFSSDLVSNFIRLTKEGKVRMLAVTGTRRIGDLPDVPTIQEQIGAPFEATAWFAIMAAAGTPADILQKINAGTNHYLQSARGRELIARQAMDAAGGTPADASAFIKQELDKWQPVIEAANIALN
jgi:tripartite-type tricarboxylate transporter receptor subunit TctC